MTHNKPLQEMKELRLVPGTHINMTTTSQSIVQTCDNSNEPLYRDKLVLWPTALGGFNTLLKHFVNGEERTKLRILSWFAASRNNLFKDKNLKNYTIFNF